MGTQSLADANREENFGPPESRQAAITLRAIAARIIAIKRELAEAEARAGALRAELAELERRHRQTSIVLERGAELGDDGQDWKRGSTR